MKYIINYFLKNMKKAAFDRHKTNRNVTISNCNAL